MNAIDRHEFISHATRILDQRESSLEGVYWFCGEDDDEGLSYCYDCIKLLKPDAVIGDDFMGGANNNESDGCETCEHCGKLLGYTLTSYGVATELEHFYSNGFDWNNSNHCYELARVAHGIFQNNEQSRKLFQIVKKGKNLPDELKALLPIKKG